MPSWYHDRGPEMRTSATVNGSAAVTARGVVKISSGVITLAGDGEEAFGVCVDAGSINETNVKVDLLVPGSIWKAPTSSLTANMGTRVAIAASGYVDAGTSTNTSPGYIVEKNCASTDTYCYIFIDKGTIA